MVMDTKFNIASQVEKLSDIELAVLLCLVANQHCIVETNTKSQHALSEELKLVRIGWSSILVSG